MNRCHFGKEVLLVLKKEMKSTIIMSNFSKIKMEKVPICTQMVENTSLSLFISGRKLIMLNCFVFLELFLKDKNSWKERVGLTKGEPILLK